MKRRRLALIVLATAVAGAGLFLAIGAILPSSRGPGPDEPPYSASAITDCLRSLKDNLPVDEENGTELVAGKRMVIGPDELEVDDLMPNPSEYIQITWIYDAQTIDTLQLQLYVAADEAAAEEILSADRENARVGGLEQADIERHFYRRGNVVFVWDPGGTEEERGQAHSCLVS